MITFLLLIIIILLIFITYKVIRIDKFFYKDRQNVVKEADYEAQYEEAKKLSQRLDYISATIIQRELRIGYAHSARILDDLAEEGLIGEQNANHQRKVLRDKSLPLF